MFYYRYLKIVGDSPKTMILIYDELLCSRWIVQIYDVRVDLMLKNRHNYRRVWSQPTQTMHNHNYCSVQVIFLIHLYLNINIVAKQLKEKKIEKELKRKITALWINKIILLKKYLYPNEMDDRIRYDRQPFGSFVLVPVIVFGTCGLIEFQAKLKKMQNWKWKSRCIIFAHRQPKLGSN